MILIRSFCIPGPGSPRRHSNMRSSIVMAENFERLATEQQNPRTACIDLVDTIEMLTILNQEDQTVPLAVAGAIPQIAATLDQIVHRLRRGGRLFYIGAGTSGRLGVLDASECPPTFGVPPEMVQGIIAGGEKALSRATEASEDNPLTGMKDLEARGFRSGDALVGIAASGRTPYVNGALEAARRMGALTIALVCVRDSAMARTAEFAIEVPVGPEPITGSTRMKSGTATKLVLNMLSTGLMIRLGLTYGNLMVNVQPRNEKLRDRARRIVVEAGGISAMRAEQLLAQAGGEVKRAIAMAKLGIGAEEAGERLRLANGVLAEVLRG